MNSDGLHHWIEVLFQSVWETSLYSSVLILIVLAILRLFENPLRPIWKYALGLLVLFRLLLPTVPESSWSLFQLGQYLKSDVSSNETVSEQLVHPSSTNLVALRNESISELPEKPLVTTNWKRVLSLCWLIGAVAFLSFTLIQHRRFMNRSKRLLLITDSELRGILESCQNFIGVRQRVELLTSDQLSVPLLFGWRKPRIIIPAALTAEEKLPELRMILMHELAHVKRHDILLNWIMITARSIHWFNPLVWIFMKRLRSERELVCDEMVMRCLDAEERKFYGETLVRLVAQFSGISSSPSAVPAVNNKKEITRRVIMIAKFKPQKRVAVLLPAALVVTLCCLTFTRAADRKADEKAKLENNSSSELSSSKSERESELRQSRVEESEKRRAANARQSIEVLKKELAKLEDYFRAQSEQVDELRQKLQIPSDIADGSRTSLREAETIRAIESELINVKTKSSQLKGVLKELKSLSQQELRQILPTTSPDPLLSSLLERLAQTEQQMVELSSSLGGEHVESKRQKALMDKINEQIAMRIEGILKGLEIQARVQEKQVERLNILLDNAKTADQELVTKYQPYFLAKKDLENLKKMIETLKLRVLQEQVDLNVPRFAPEQ